MAYKIPMPVDYELIQPGYYSNGTNICFDCEKACGGCSWSEVDPNTNKVKFEPVPGSKTIKRCRNNGIRYEVVEQIVECPLFDRTPDRKDENV